MTTIFDKACFLMSLPFILLSALASVVAMFTYKTASILSPEWEDIWEKAQEDK